jgi:hypothetical protein
MTSRCANQTVWVATVYFLTLIVIDGHILLQQHHL